ncbi:MAG: hypothetical protein CM1200mP14_29000 [Gammaproteobacteria bacterium]|nr:MAG: hypothetical protein CM1200mP14_29000 [Gammaproteobacteria bacterium]
MMVVDYIERLLPLPDFESWVKDFLTHPEVYRLYTHTLPRGRDDYPELNNTCDPVAALGIRL